VDIIFCFPKANFYLFKNCLYPKRFLFIDGAFSHSTKVYKTGPWSCKRLILVFDSSGHSLVQHHTSEYILTIQILNTNTIGYRIFNNKTLYKNKRLVNHFLKSNHGQIQVQSVTKECWLLSMNCKKSQNKPLSMNGSIIKGCWIGVRYT